MNISLENQSYEFTNTKTMVEKKKSEIYELQNKLNLEKKIYDNLVKNMQSICNHYFIRECTTSGCYAEYHHICKYCNYWR